VREIAGLAPREYVERLERQPQGEISYLCKVSHANGRPICSSRTAIGTRILPSGITAGWQIGRHPLRRPDFVKVALNVVRLPNDDATGSPDSPELVRLRRRPPSTRHEVVP